MFGDTHIPAIGVLVLFLRKVAGPWIPCLERMASLREHVSRVDFKSPSLIFILPSSMRIILSPMSRNCLTSLHKSWRKAFLGQRGLPIEWKYAFRCAYTVNGLFGLFGRYAFIIHKVWLFLPLYLVYVHLLRLEASAPRSTAW
jgi:hypothetical protein